jgi:hypothetical protein
MDELATTETETGTPSEMDGLPGEANVHRYLFSIVFSVRYRGQCREDSALAPQAIGTGTSWTRH